MPCNDRRRWNVGNVATAEELAEKLSGDNHTWTLCTGFRHGGFLFLNDSFSEDGAAEWAVVRESDLRQVESITFGWCTEAEALRYIRGVLAGEACDWFKESRVRLEQVTTHPDESFNWKSCRLCA